MNFEIYCDESQQELFGSPTELRKGKFTTIGGLWIEASIRQDVKEAIEKTDGYASIYASGNKRCIQKG